MPYRWASSKISEELAAHIYNVKSWTTFSLKTEAAVCFEISVSKNRNGLLCQETVIFTSTSFKTSIFALLYSVFYLFSVFIINLCIPSSPSLFHLLFKFCATYFSLRTFAFLLKTPLISFSFLLLFLSEILSFQVFYFISLHSFVYFCILSSKTFTALLNTSECKTYRSVSRSAGSRWLYFGKDFTYNCSLGHFVRTT